ncbi:hypothetical protein FSU_0617 [Fibrobacter succinogenes subsp. succinogenes S85]|uniref:Uncharacterized protein n=1 Tax=Fibrobacter succinogenes (strain ATCC 19169 / S85) TaxID=59374 RepID=D9S790_FIBSS|nr:hypothetical protein FSU_0617 [Fibrobacter succinogenes subsp. succinogenes S85]
MEPCFAISNALLHIENYFVEFFIKTFKILKI